MFKPFKPAICNPAFADCYSRLHIWIKKNVVRLKKYERFRILPWRCSVRMLDVNSLPEAGQSIDQRTCWFVVSQHKHFEWDLHRGFASRPFKILVATFTNHVYSSHCIVLHCGWFMCWYMIIICYSPCIIFYEHTVNAANWLPLCSALWLWICTPKWIIYIDYL